MTERPGEAPQFLPTRKNVQANDANRQGPGSPHPGRGSRAGRWLAGGLLSLALLPAGWAAQAGTAQAGTAQTGTAQVSTAQTGTAQVSTVAGAQAATSATAPRAASAPASPRLAGGHDDHATPNPSPSTGGTPAGHDGTQHDADTHVDLPEGGEEWTMPDQVAQGALVRIETVADVYVALHHYHVEKFRYSGVSDPQAVSSGTFVNSRGLVITSKGALRDDGEQEERFGTWGINQAFVAAKFLDKLPADPFSRTTITARNKGPLADSPPTDPKINDRLQSCYDWETSHHCAVFVVMHQRVMPSVQKNESSTLEGLPQSDSRVAVLSTQPRGLTPLTLQLANPEPGAKYWVVSSRGVNEEPQVGTGTLTDSERSPISDADLAKWAKQFGPMAEGAPVVSDRGDLVAFLGTPEGSDKLGAVSASHMSNDIRTFGLTRDSSPVDAQFQDGLELFEASQFAAAVPKLKAAVEATGGQRVARELLGQAEDRSGTAEDLSDEADALTDTGDESSGWSPMAIAIFTALVVIVLIAAMVGVAITRRRNWPGPDDDTGETGLEAGGAGGTGFGDGKAADGTSPGTGAGTGAGTDTGGPGARAGRVSAETAQSLIPAAVAHRNANSGTQPDQLGELDQPGRPGQYDWSARSGRTGQSGQPGQPAPARRFAPPEPSPSASPVAGGAGANGRPAPGARPTTLFATGTTDPKPAVGRADPSGQADPTDLHNPADPADPADRTHPTDPTGPSVHTAPTDRTDPADPSVRTAPADPTDPSVRTDPAPETDPGEAPTQKRAAPVRPSGGFCRQCGSQLSPGDRFCFSCGSPSGASSGRR